MYSVAICYHRDANPPHPGTPATFQLWTRHNFAAIRAQRGMLLPLFHHSDSEASRTLWARYHASFYDYTGTYFIDEAELVPGRSDAVLAFVKGREESRRRRPAEKWKAMLESDWLKVTVRRSEKQARNPMLQDTRRSMKGEQGAASYGRCCVPHAKAQPN